MLLSLAIIFISCLFVSKLFEKMHLPSLLGMILLGILFGPYAFNLIDASILLNSNAFRQIALVIILTRAGLSLNLQDLKQFSLTTLLLCFVPACLEILGITIFAPLFFDISYIDALLIGSVLAAVSPAVLVPRMIKLIDEGYQKVPQMLLAAASVDDVFVLVLFSAFTNLATSSQIRWTYFLQIPTSIILGILLGIITGYFIHIVFKFMKLKTTYQILFMLAIAFLLLSLETILKPYIAISALLAIMTYSIVIKYLNKQQALIFANNYLTLWQVFEILLFFLVGTCVDLTYLLQASILSIVLIFIALLFRMIGVACCFIKTTFPLKERLFTMIAYIPKATVQAGIAAIPLQLGLSCGPLCLTLGVLSILITATLGAIGIDLSYQKLLHK